MSRFLQGQARQEAFHATLFHCATACIAPRHQRRNKYFPPLTEYRATINRAISRKDFLETILAEQVILECLGEATLHKLELGLKKRDAPFQGLRRLLLHQEAAHHGFGERVLEQAIGEGKTSYPALREKATPYLALSEAIILSLQDRLKEINENPQSYIDAHHQTLPSWLMDDPKGPCSIKDAIDSFPLSVDYDRMGHSICV